MSMNKEERIGMYTSDEIYEELANGFLQRSMVDAMYFKIKDLQQRIDKALHFIIDYNDRVFESSDEIQEKLYEILRCEE